jgi:type II secretory pathway pseudopilin PulG
VTHFKSHSARHSGGFTLIEIMVILIMLGVLAGGAMSAFPDSNANLATEADRLRSHLRYAQIRAQADVYQWRLVFTDATTYQIGPVVIPGAGFTPGVVPGSDGTQGGLTDGVTAIAGTVIRFDSWGRPLSDWGNVLGADKAITLTAGARNESITIRAGTGLIP